MNFVYYSKDLIFMEKFLWIICLFDSPLKFHFCIDLKLQVRTLYNNGECKYIDVQKCNED